MPLKNTATTYGWVAVAFHWLSAITVFSLFGLGLWMVSLDYYHPWYKEGPDLHRSIGVVLVVATLLRFVWRCLNIKPVAEPGPRWQVKVAGIVHGLLYGWFFLMLISGYLITTAKGQGLEVFNWFEIPAYITDIENLEDRAGVVHFYLACIFMGLVAVHAGAALYHHFIKRDATLRKMLGKA